VIFKAAVDRPQSLMKFLLVAHQRILQKQANFARG
jgi:hypothetical protein